MSENEPNINCEDIAKIFKGNLKIENKLKSISSIFMNERFSKKINYSPYFQRNYVWDESKATYFIESILIGTEIPPLVLFDNGKENQVIDGRQRYETITKFINNRIYLKEDGLRTLKSLSGKYYKDLDEDVKEVFEETKLRILQCCVVNEPHLSEKKEDKVKKEIFRRYNSGITPLHKEEIERAEFINDNLTMKFYAELTEDVDLFTKSKELFLSSRKKKVQERDVYNNLLSEIRTLLVLPYIPIRNYANSSNKGDVLVKYYYKKRDEISVEEAIDDYRKIINVIWNIKSHVDKCGFKATGLILLYECCYWCLAILKRNGREYSEFDSEDFVKVLMKNSEVEYMWNDIEKIDKDVKEIFEQTGSHFYKSILNRYIYLSNYFKEKFNIDFKKNFKDPINFKVIMEFEEDETEQLEKYRIHKVDPTSMTIEDIMKKINKHRFLIRPDYQRSEVSNISKSSYLLESIMLEMKVPPIYIYKRRDKVYEVIDGQQRLLSIIGFLGETYVDIDGEKKFSQKNLFKLKGLRILEELNGKDIDSIGEKYKEKILDFQIDVIEINAGINENFDNIDLFLRLNTKPYPIRPNSFEMWNAYVDKETIIKIKEIAEENEGKIFGKKDTRMSIEELVTTLVYLDYKERLGTTPYDILNIYIKNNRVNTRVKNKSGITKVLEAISNDDNKKFLQSINNIKKFLDKVWILLEDDKDNLPKLFCANNSKGGKTNQNYYILWLLLRNIEKTYLRQKRSVIFKKIQDVYLAAQKAEKITVEDFLKMLDNIK